MRAPEARDRATVSHDLDQEIDEYLLEKERIRKILSRVGGMPSKEAKILNRLLMVFVALALLASDHGLSPLVASVGVVFGILAAGVPLVLVGLLGRRAWRAPRWLPRLPWAESTIAEATEATPLLTIDRRLVLANALPSLGTFLLDAATLMQHHRHAVLCPGDAAP